MAHGVVRCVIFPFLSFRQMKLFRSYTTADAMGKGLRAEARGRPLCSRWPQGGALICEPQRTAGPVRSKQGLLFVCWGKEGQDLRQQDCLSPGRRKRRRPDSLQLCPHFAPSNVKMRQTATSTVISLHANPCSTTKKSVWFMTTTHYWPGLRAAWRSSSSPSSLIDDAV